jgi:hypothetical protein
VEVETPPIDAGVDTRHRRLELPAGFRDTGLDWGAKEELHFLPSERTTSCPGDVLFAALFPDEVLKTGFPDPRTVSWPGDVFFATVFSVKRTIS